MKESDMMRRIQIEASEKYGARLFRNSVGFDRERRVKYGLCVGSADLIGWTRDGRFVAIEVKTARGRLSIEQTRFLEAVDASGGVAGVARCLSDLGDLLQ